MARLGGEVELFLACAPEVEDEAHLPLWVQEEVGDLSPGGEVSNLIREQAVKKGRRLRALRQDGAAIGVVDGDPGGGRCLILSRDVSVGEQGPRVFL